MSFTRRPGSGRPRHTSHPVFRHIGHTAPTAGMVVWGFIAYNTRSPLVLIHGTMTVQRYVNDILQPHVLPLMQRLTGAIFQQDNARLHMARVSQDCLPTELPFFVLTDPQICPQSNIYGIIWGGKLALSSKLRPLIASASVTVKWKYDD
ncbi:transposable element Tcb1 transposase [Trichonephila clavipes]|nr:transposable element Tcb1 transposase [Trichonephila clavipes]